MRALRDFNMPKIVTEDVAIFLGLLSDLFPGLEVERERSSEFEKAVRQTTLELRLQPEEPFILKVQQNIIQILNQMNERKSANEEFVCSGGAVGGTAFHTSFCVCYWECRNWKKQGQTIFMAVPRVLKVKHLRYGFIFSFTDIESPP